MRQSLRITRFGAWAVMLATAVVLSCTCLVAGAMTSGRKACCAVTAHGCGEQAMASPCCPGEGHDGRALVTAKLEASVMPVAASSPALGVAPASFAVVLSWSASVSSRVGPPGGPPYLLVSSLRI